jgi:hypothetical protein
VKNALNLNELAAEKVLFHSIQYDSRLTMSYKEILSIADGHEQEVIFLGLNHEREFSCS